MEGVTMNEFELQTRVMKHKSVKPADKFAMMCILKSVDWDTWQGSVSQMYISTEYNINRRTLTRTLTRLSELGWIKVDVIRVGYDKHQTTITVNINAIKPQGQFVHTEKDKLSTPIRTECPHREGQIDHTDKDKLTTPIRTDCLDREGQIDPYINNNNNNNKDINEDTNEDKADESLEYVTRAEAIMYTNNFHPRDLRHLADDRDKVPLHILDAKNKRFEIDRRVAVVEEERGRKMGHHERMNFDGSQRDEDSKIYHAFSFEFKNIRKVW